MNNFMIKINGKNIRLDMVIDKHFVMENHLKKIKSTEKRLFSHLKNANYIRRDCLIECLNGDFILNPINNSSEDLDYRFDVASYYFLYKKRIQAIEFQIIYDIEKSSFYYKKFHELMIRKYGKPEYMANEKFPTQFSTWKLGTSFITVELSVTARHCFFWLYKASCNYLWIYCQLGDERSFCPKCLAKYREGYLICSDCDDPLINIYES